MPNDRSYAMRGAVPVVITAHLLTIAATRQVSALNPALRIPLNVMPHTMKNTGKWIDLYKL